MPGFGANAVQLMLWRGKSASCMAPMAYVKSTVVASIAFLEGAMAGGFADPDKVWRVLGDRLQIVRRRDEKIRELLCAKFLSTRRYRTTSVKQLSQHPHP
jgi:hypothetical protein